MSEIQNTMKFELLPNEIIIECFEYLNASDIFYSFDQLNYRFHKIIHTIPLNLNFQYVHKSTFDYFCMKIISNPSIKRQIYSLHLSNRNTSGQIQSFLSYFSLEDFSHLQLLTLTGVQKNNMELLKSMLPLISKLYCFRLIEPIIESEELISILPMSQLRTLSLPISDPSLISDYQILPITNIAGFSCPLNKLYDLFQCAPMLKYLNIKHISKKSVISSNDEIALNNSYGIHLKRLIINQFDGTFEDFEIFAKQIPNLKSLTIFTDDNIDMINAYRWQRLITNSLPYLDIFKFKFIFFYENKDNIINKLKQFQNDFWQKQHHWYTEYILSKYTAFIYTIPYPSNKLTLLADLKRYSNKLVNNINTFDNVTDLILFSDAIDESNRLYFSNVTSVTFVNKGMISEDAQQLILNQKSIKYLKKMINLSHLKHLEFSLINTLDASCILLEILKQAPQLSSLTINPRILVSLYNDNELCKYLNKMIKTLDIQKYSHYSLKPSEEIEQCSKIFPNILELKCNDNEPNDLLILLSRLTKLTMLKIFLSKNKDGEQFLSWFKNELQKLELKFFIEFSDKTEKVICLWINRNLN